ncbi:hypothetical protein BJX70DRAFT_394689 [Aspergillus crustosus]
MDTDNSEWASEPIAIIGMSCKFSGGASSPEKLWDLMASGKTGWSEIPEDRFNLQGVYHPNHERTSTTHVKGGHFLDEDVAAFDAAFFNYSAEMAQVVDPQFRLQLESTYEALENAGLPLSLVTGTQTSVFAGVFTHDYQDGLIRDEDRLPRFNVVGTWSPMSSNRISHFFDLRGASMTLETGCSTTLVALHQAVSSLRNREADMSIVTGANVMLNPDTFKVIGSLGMLSPDGRSYAFDSRANGYGRGEGVATIIVKRLSDALASNDPIRAVIRETALNQDGKTDTITTPSGKAQAELMRECYRRAGLDPRGTQYFEAHGTGTPAGDPIEAAAMAEVFSSGEGREDPERYLRIGSVKTNVGHTEAASGLAAVVKGVLSLEKGQLPPSVNYESPNPKLRLDEWRLRVVRDTEEWPESMLDGPRRMSINNFGYGGANAHVILESAEPWVDISPVLGNGLVNGTGVINDAVDDSAKVLLLSARDERGCQQMVSDLKAYLERHRSLSLDASEKLLRNLSYTLCERRTLFQWVSAHQVRLEKTIEPGCSPLDAAIQALDTPRFKPVRRVSDTNPRIGMIFTGQGAQWYAMGRELLTSYRVFRRSIDDTNVHTTKISIPVCVALQIALVQLLESWGITPAAVASHSSGEISAAFAVGALTHRQAIATAYYRAVLVAEGETRREPGAAKGAMAAVGLGVEEVQPYLDRVPKEKGRAVVACVNSPQSVTISGDSDAVAEIEDLCKQDGVFARRLKVQQAYHSHHMNPFANSYRESLRAELARNSTKRPKQDLKAVFSSAVTGTRITDISQLANPDHWVGSLVQPVEFVDAFTEMVLGDPDDPSGTSVDVLLEVGPHTALGGPIREILSLPEFAHIDIPYWGCLVRDEHAGDSMRAAALNLFRHGQVLTMHEINFPTEDGAYEDEHTLQVVTDLPSYPWNHSMRHWQESRVNRAIRERSDPPHELLGMPVPGTDPSTNVWRRILRVSETPWVRDHMVQGSIVYPGSGYICHAIEAARQLEKAGDGISISGFRLRDVQFLFACVIPDNADGVEIRTTLHPASDHDLSSRGWRHFEVSSVTLENRWTLHAKGMILVEHDQTPLGKSEQHRALSTYTRQPDPQDLFANLRSCGITHGPLFQNTTRIIQDGRMPRSICDITIRHEVSTDMDPILAAKETLLHPITLDAVVVAFYSVLPSVGALQEDPKLPRSVASMWVSAEISGEIGHTLQCDTTLVHDDAASGTADITVFDSNTESAVLKIQGVELASLGRGSGATARQDAANRGVESTWEQEVCSKLVWGPDLSLGSQLALEQVRREVEGISSPLAQLATLLHRVLHKNPSARILCTGNGEAGSGLVLRGILESFGTPRTPLTASWHITEPSSEALDETRSHLASWAQWLEFDQLDIAQSPAKQKFAAGSNDIVISLKATDDANATLAHVRSLLKQGGTLLLVDNPLKQVSVTCNNDVLPGWPYRKESSSTTSSWDTVLRDAGFNGADLEIADAESNSTLLLSTLPLSDDHRPSLKNVKEVFAVVTDARTTSPPGFVDLLSQRIHALTGTTVDTPAPEHLTLEQSSRDSYKGKICIFLGEIANPIMADLEEAQMEGLRAMVTQCAGLLWVTIGATVDGEDPERAVHQGFLRVLRNEYIGRRFISLDLDPVHATERWASGGKEIVEIIGQVLGQGFGASDTAADSGSAEFEYADRNGVIHVPRYYKDQRYNDMVTGPLVPSWGKDDKTTTINPLEPLFQEGRPLRLEVGIPGHLDTVAFVDDTEDYGVLAPDLVEITPRAFGLCSRDVMASMGQLKDRSIGFECAGIITSVGAGAETRGYNVGDCVMALLPGASSFATSVRVPWHGVVHIPSGMDFVHAASLPLSFTIAYTSLVDTARLAPGQSVLIHSAAGAIGQAAIMIAQHLGVTEIYATAGSQEKRDILTREYGLPAERIFSSRDASFAAGILAATRGRGVDVVLNSLPGPLLQASLSAVAPLGYLVEIGKRDIESNSLVALKAFSRGISFVSLDVPTLLSRRGPDVHRALKEVVRLIEQEKPKPVSPITVYPMQDLQSAFGFIQTGAHVGKVILSASPEEQALVIPRPRGLTPRPRLNPNASYLIVGGIGGIGRSITHWLISHGARNLIILSRSAGNLDLPTQTSTPGALFIQELRSMGCRVMPISCDISLTASLTTALRTCANAGLPPVRGVIQAAMLLRDAVFEQMSLDDWTTGLSPKLFGTFNLHTEFSTPNSLDFFIMLSSVSGVVGIASQANYAAGGAYQDSLARWRQAKGLPGVAIDLGPISDIGYVATERKVAERLRRDGDFVMLDEGAVLRALNAAVLYPGGDSVRNEREMSRAQMVVGLNSAPGPQWDASGRSQLGRDARFMPLRPRSIKNASDDSHTSGPATLASQLSSLGADDRATAADLIGAAIATKLAEIFMMPVTEIDLAKPPGHFGVDSLVAVEVRNMLVLQAAADVSIFDILQAGSLRGLAGVVVEKSRLLMSG